MPAPKGNDYAKGNKGGVGGPEVWDEKNIPIAQAMAELGATNTEIGKALGVAESTIRYWQGKHKDFAAALKLGKDKSDDRVERSLFERAMGYTHAEDKIFMHEGEPVVVPTVKHYPPDATSAIFWLKNRRPDEWREKVDHDHSGEVSIHLPDGAEKV